MRFANLAWMLSLAVVLLGVPQAGRADSVGGTRIYLAFFGGIQSYGMSDLNHEIDAVNADLEGSGFAVKKIRRGVGFGSGIRVWPSSRLCLLFDYIHLVASASGSGLIGGVPVSSSFALPANGFTATAGYFRSWHAVRYGVGGGAGYYLCKGKLEVNAGGARAFSEVKGSGPGYQALAIADIKASNLHFEAAIGYRYAKTTSLKSNGVAILLDDGSKETADWNGLVTRFGISIPFDPGPYPPMTGSGR